MRAYIMRPLSRSAAPSQTASQECTHKEACYRRAFGRRKNRGRNACRSQTCSREGSLNCLYMLSDELLLTLLFLARRLCWDMVSWSLHSSHGEGVGAALVGLLQYLLTLPRCDTRPSVALCRGRHVEAKNNVGNVLP
nr:hypothetical protein CFP56_02972 [Quercus suber]